jgi:hypothetical protein
VSLELFVRIEEVRDVAMGSIAGTKLSSVTSWEARGERSSISTETGKTSATCCSPTAILISEFELASEASSGFGSKSRPMPCPIAKRRNLTTVQGPIESMMRPRASDATSGIERYVAVANKDRRNLGVAG